ncbi:MAG: helix-turn-helix domain-containing protein [Symploca sp. SIO2D2]|nr:helix-turn-helix domain-containing protein [Symploca sp. SIO2D2]
MIHEKHVAAIKWGDELGKRLESLRGEISLRDLEAKTEQVGQKVSFQYIQQLEQPSRFIKRIKNDYLSVSLDVLKVLCLALDTDLSDLLDLTKIKISS